MIFNMKGPQVACANYSIQQLHLPVILEYEDDHFSSVHGEALDTYIGRLRQRAAHRLLRVVSGCVAVSPYLLSQIPPQIPRLLVRGVVGQDVVEARCGAQKKNIVLFSGTHVRANGVEELIEAWRSVYLPNWELHITGYGQLTESVKQVAREVPGVVFHGLIDRSALVRLMCAAKICINPFVKTPAPGSVFAFKIVEYLAAGAHVISTPMGALEEDIETGITYMPDNSPATIATTLKAVIESRRYELRATDATQLSYGPKAITASLDRLVRTVVKRISKDPSELSNLAFS
jgi:glycosyltransferase involved in cell wall biosynthesis